MAIYRRGNVYWARWVEDGKQHRRSLRTEDPRVAEERFEALTAKDGPSLTMREILSGWFKYQSARCKPYTLDVYKTARKRFSIMWGDLRPEQLTTLVVEEAQERLLGVGLNPRTINHQIASAVAAVKWAAERGLTDAQPPKYKRLKLNGNPTRKYLTADELGKLITTVREPRWERLEVAVMLSLYAGLRQGEIAWLTWEDVDLEAGWLHVRAKKGWSPKSANSERSVPLADELAAYLTTARRVCSTWVAPQSLDTRWCRRHLGAETRRLFIAAGVDDGGPHTLHRLRGTFATTVLRDGGDLESLKELLGHSLLSVTAGYLSATSESKRRSVRGLSFPKNPVPQH